MKIEMLNGLCDFLFDRSLLKLMMDDEMSWNTVKMRESFMSRCCLLDTDEYISTDDLHFHMVTLNRHIFIRRGLGND